jgi:valyl-tRNA synthetase
MDFGTGAIGITPMHSQVDAEISARHGIEGYQVIDELRRILVEPYKGLKTGEARELILKWLAQNNLLTNTEKITQNIALAERTGGIIEPLPKKQWFVAVNKVYRNYQNQETTLKNEMVNALREEGGVSILPENFAKIYINWVENLRDWCISRQIWYGHRIPVWYRRHDSREGNQGLEIQKSNLDEDRDIQVGEKPLDIDNWEQDPDTLDTWFSSGLWTFSTLGWPEETRDLKTYHPNSLVISGYEILFFWIARMILMSKSLLGEIPFKKVYIHGMVRDKQGRKFSKSLGNGIDPIEIIDKYGADALRMALVIGASPGSDSKFDESKVSAYRKFSNKLWNISRFVLSHERTRQGSQVLKTDLKEEFDSLSRDILNDMHSYRFDIAAEKLYAYIWHRFADEIIEKSKGQDDYGDTLYYILENSLKLLHPFMPFITEEIWQELRPGSLLMIEPLPSN